MVQSYRSRRDGAAVEAYLADAALIARLDEWLAPWGGPRLGPFPKRSQALEAERQWLEQHWLPGR